MSAVYPANRSLRQVLQQLAAIGIVPLAVLGAYGVWSAVESQQRDLQRSTLEISRALAIAVESELDANIGALQAMGRSPLLAQGDIRAFYDFVSTEVAARSWWAGVNLVDAEGGLLFKSVLPFGSGEARLIAPAEVEETLREGRPTVGMLAAGKRNAMAFPVRVPIAEGGRVKYVLTAAVKPDRILQAVQRQQVEEKWVISVFDRGLQRVARSKNHEATLGKLPTRSLQDFIAAHPEDSASGISVTIDGEQAFTGFTRLDHGWIVAVGAPTTEGNAALKRGIAWYVAGILTSIALCLAFAWRSSQRIVKSIHGLRQAAVELGAGAHPIVVKRIGIAELDDMANALSAASHRLADATATVTDALQQATAAGRAKDEFMALLGHELRNPLSPIVTTLHLMDLQGDSSSVRERQIMRRQVDHLRRLVDDLLDISRIATGKLQIERRTLNLFGVIEQAAEAVQPLLKDQPTGLVVTLPEQPVWVQGDETRLVQAVTNLLTNAVRFGGGSRIELSLIPRGLEVAIQVRDEGEGMTAEALSKVFEPFYQAPQTTARPTGGLGLGLSIVRSIVELHEGRVVAASAGPGRGSTFEICLQVVDSQAAEDGFIATQASSPTGRGVLIVDDNVDALESLSTVFEVAGYEVRIAVSADAAMKEARSFRPDIAILDIGLPDMNGYDLARAMQALPGGCGALIALTGYGQLADKEAAMAAGFALHFTKPTDPAALLLAIERLLASAQPI
ncbi:response regulator [Aquincola sp. S2]|uniref:histidine kinase n=1 Tax=Pseudaquabacterium terrae TaxID=2732868 RepID=A0ABX2ES95_9BURK|nr:ATP-binding protein [Aquabacterium terrae]NRF71392.1 response regulator [Aquabacterium terrae]